MIEKIIDIQKILPHNADFILKKKNKSKKFVTPFNFLVFAINLILNLYHKKYNFFNQIQTLVSNSNSLDPNEEFQ